MAEETKEIIKPKKKERRAVAFDLIQKTNRENPAPEDLDRLRKEFDEVPELYRNVGNSANTIIHRILDDLSGKSAFVREATERYMSEMKTELGFHTSTFVEKMLINEILMRWLRLQVIENDHKSLTYQSHTLTEGMYYEKRLHMAQKRYLRAMETLVRVRQMIAGTQAKGAQMFKNLLTGQSGQDSKIQAENPP